MILSRQNTRVIVAALFLSIATTGLLLVTKNRQAIASEPTLLKKQSLLLVEGKSMKEAEEYTTHLFNLSGEELVQFQGQLEQFSPDRQRLITLASVESQLHYLFDMSGRRLLQFKAKTADFSPDSQRIVSTSDGVTSLYDAMGRELAQLPRSLGLPPIFSPNGQRIVVVADGRAYLLNTSGEQIAEIPGHFFPLGSGFDSMSQRFILHRIGDARTCDLFDASGQTIAQLPEECAGILPNGQSFLVMIGALNEASVQLYDFSGQKMARIPTTLPALSPNGQFLLTTDFFPGNLSHLYRSSGREIAELQGTFGRFSSTGQRLVTVSGNTVHLYDLSGNEIAQLPGHLAAFLPGSDRFVTFLENSENRSLSSSGETRLFDGDGRELALLTGNPDSDIELFGAGSPSQISEFYQGSISSLSSDGQRIATSDEENCYLYDASGNQIAVLPGVFLSFSSTGQHLITVAEGKVRLFDRSGNQVMETAGQLASFSPDGQRLAVSAQNTLP